MLEGNFIIIHMRSLKKIVISNEKYKSYMKIHMLFILEDTLRIVGGGNAGARKNSGGQNPLLPP